MTVPMTVPMASPEDLEGFGAVQHRQEALLGVLSELVADQSITDHQKPNTDAESGLDDFECYVFQILTKQFCEFNDLRALLMFLVTQSAQKAGVIEYQTDGGEVAVHPLLLNLLKDKIEKLHIQHDDIKALERTFYLFVGMESDEYSTNFCEENEDDFDFEFDLYANDFIVNPIRDIAAKGLQILALLSQRLYQGEQSVSEIGGPDPTAACLPIVSRFILDQLKISKEVQVKRFAKLRKCIKRVINFLSSLVFWPKSAPAHQACDHSTQSDNTSQHASLRPVYLYVSNKMKSYNPDDSNYKTLAKKRKSISKAHRKVAAGEVSLKAAIAQLQDDPDIRDNRNKWDCWHKVPRTLSMLGIAAAAG